MERILKKAAKQINALDEASLTALWEKYAAQVAHFEPSDRWQEAVIVLSMIQGVRYKNQLFNYNWSLAQELEPDPGSDGRSAAPDASSSSSASGDSSGESSGNPSGDSSGKSSGKLSGPAGRDASAKRGKVLKFVRREDG